MECAEEDELSIEEGEVGRGGGEGKKADEASLQT